jgi:hypothetical protein
MEIPLMVAECAGLARWDEPVAVGVPLARGAVHEPGGWVVRDAQGREQGCEVRVLQDWPDGSVRWLEASFGLSVPARADSVVRLCRLPTDRPAFKRLMVAEDGDECEVVTPRRRYLFYAGSDCLFESLDSSGQSPPTAVRLQAGGQKERFSPEVVGVDVQREGLRIAEIRLHGWLDRRAGLLFDAGLRVFSEQSRARIELTVHNPRRARHSGGFWDLGDPGSILLRDLTLQVETPLDAARQVVWCDTPESPLQATACDRWQLVQDSSGGENWRSRTHVNRENRVPLRFRGYQVQFGESMQHGLRASPTVALQDDRAAITVAMPEFWQRFPSALEVRQSQLLVHLLPPQSDDLHELQAGEQTTRIVWIEWENGTGSDRPDRKRSRFPLAWVHAPLRVRPAAAWVADSGAVPYFPRPDAAVGEAYRQILREALQGPNNFFAKREAVDEYGWRNFGDMWADHEQAYCPDERRPVISHYNNQYDLLYGLLIQWLLTGDHRWWELADPLARHVLDIDIYHTQRDKAAYNGGLFWHTAHYHDAATATHRSMSRAMCGKSIPASGGGPANEHNYAAGLRLYYELTGDQRAREAVLGLADWVVAMDDGQQHLLGLVSDCDTGFASMTSQPGYHGPGRGAGNSIHSLLDGWLVTDGDERYLTKIEQLIRRTVHPADDLSARTLDDAELRWSYTVYLQSLARFIELTDGVERLETLRAYARLSLLHYARWMADHERFYLDTPEQLEYPTETWAAQELRKGTTLLMAARWSDGPQHDRFRQRGLEILDGAWQRLLAFPTRDCTRPLALVLQQGYLETFLRSAASESCGPLDAADRPALPAPIPFVSQKQWVREALRSPARWPLVLCRLLRPAAWQRVIHQTWLAERFRR